MLHSIIYISTAFQTLIPVPPDSVQTVFNATVGESVVLPCVISPRALLQYCTVEWMRDNILIHTNQEANPQDHIVTETNPRYSIDGAYSLVISSVDVNDSSSRYQCVLHSTNPETGVRQELYAYPQRDILLTLHVLDTSASTEEPESDEFSKWICTEIRSNGG